MTQVPELYDLASRQNIAVLRYPMKEVGSMSIMEPDGKCYIGVDDRVLDGGIQERMHLSHELGHCITVADEGGEAQNFIVHGIGDIAAAAEEGELDILLGHRAHILFRLRCIIGTQELGNRDAEITAKLINDVAGGLGIGIFLPFGNGGFAETRIDGIFPAAAGPEPRGLS